MIIIIMIMIMKIKLYIFVTIMVLQLVLFCQTKNFSVNFQGHVVKLIMLFVNNLYRLFAEINCF